MPLCLWCPKSTKIHLKKSTVMSLSRNHDPVTQDNHIITTDLIVSRFIHFSFYWTTPVNCITSQKEAGMRSKVWTVPLKQRFYIWCYFIWLNLFRTKTFHERIQWTGCLRVWKCSKIPWGLPYFIALKPCLRLYHSPYGLSIFLWWVV